MHRISELHFEVTGECSLNCDYCYNSAFRNRKDELTFDEIKKLFKECKKHKCKLYTLTGGDPFSRADFFKILDLLKGERVSILTNGRWLYLHPDLINIFKRRFPQVKEFKISWDGFFSHTMMRGQDWQEVEQVVRILKANRYRVVINTIVLEPNQNSLFSLYEKLCELKVDRWRVDMPFLMGSYVNNHKWLHPPNPKRYTKQFAKILKDRFKRRNKMVFEVFNLYKSEFEPKSTIIWNDDNHPCEYKRDLLSMKPNGDIVFCPSMTFKMANFREAGYKLAKAFAQEKRHKFYKLRLSNIAECKGCRYYRICGGGCRCNSICDYGTWDRKDNSACITFPLWEKNILPVLPKRLQRFFVKLIAEDGFNPSEAGCTNEVQST